MLDYLSGEGEIKARVERTIIGDKGLRISFGTGFEYAHYRNSTYRLIYTGSGENEINYNTNLKLGKIQCYSDR